jgi:hypothetical protein
VDRWPDRYRLQHKVRLHVVLVDTWREEEPKHALPPMPTPSLAAEPLPLNGMRERTRQFGGERSFSAGRSGTLRLLDTFRKFQAPDEDSVKSMGCRKTRGVL